ncbi:hypothetical protein J437_LFUL002991 [Ladona fulva]|uniref:Uncharacterized protein n=1 Tax=Ladona fulva TaxID=123851 RepID=A0A8K0JTY4_LADFU|nr:hypothetical protein J437_LFUL002991 [Ladona fulva]
MKVPTSIPKSACKAYKPSKECLNLSVELNRILKAEFASWDEGLPKNLSDLAVEALIRNFSVTHIWEGPAGLNPLLPCHEHNLSDMGDTGDDPQLGVMGPNGWSAWQNEEWVDGEIIKEVEKPSEGSEITQDDKTEDGDKYEKDMFGPDEDIDEGKQVLEYGGDYKDQFQESGDEDEEEDECEDDFEDEMSEDLTPKTTMYVVVYFCL